MTELDDHKLLAEFARSASESAFDALVARYVNLVYSTALRFTGNPHHAQEITQAVFIILARKAGSLRRETVLSGWLYQTARLTAANFVKGETRWQRPEQEAYMLSTLNESDTAAWQQIAPLLDDAMGELGGTDRNAVVLRFFENKTAQEVGAALKLTEAAAHKRVSRALEKLRLYLSKRGIVIPAAALTAAISANAVQAAPVGLAITISTAAALAGTTLATATTATAIKTIAMTTLQKAVITTTLAVVAGVGIYEARQNSQLRQQVQTFQQEHAPLADQIQTLQKSYNDATNQLATLRDDNERLNRNTGELLRLRAEVGQLRRDAVSTTPADSVAKKWAAQVTLLKQKLKELPNRDIPELQFATEKEWANAAWDADLETEDGIREALSKVRDNAEETFLNQMRPAIERYLSANDNILPTQLSDLKAYFKTPVTDDMLQRYKLLQTGKPSSNRDEDLVKLNIHADEDYDSNRVMSLAGQGAGRYNRIKEAVVNAAEAFARDNNGQLPQETSQIQSYVQKQIDPACVKKYLMQFAEEKAK